MRIVFAMTVFLTACGPWTLRTGRVNPAPSRRIEKEDSSHESVACSSHRKYLKEIRTLTLRRTDLALDQALVLSLIEQARLDDNQQAERMLWKKYMTLEQEKKRVDLEFLGLQRAREADGLKEVAWVSSSD